MSEQKAKKEVTVADAIAKTQILKDVEMIIGSEGHKNFFVIHEGTMIRVAMKLTAEVDMQKPRMVLRVRIVKQANTVFDLPTMWKDRLQKKFDEANVEHAKVDDTRLSFVISSGKTILEMNEVFDFEVKDMVDALLEKTVSTLNIVFGMGVTADSFKLTLTEICSIGLPKGIEDLTGLKTEGAKMLDKKKAKKATVTEIGKKEK